MLCTHGLPLSWALAHSGMSYVQVEVIMPATWNVKQSHDVALSLQHKVCQATACHHLLQILQPQMHL